MNWKSSLQVLDLDPTDKLEMTCRRCGHVRYITQSELLRRTGTAQLWLDEVERRARCRQRSCEGEMRMALTRLGDTSGFVGGLA